MTGFTSPDRGPETDAILGLLSDGGVLVGDSGRPDGGGFPDGDTTKPFTPYGVLYQGITTDVDGPVGDPFADTENEYQLTSIGHTRASASVIADRSRGIMLGGGLAVDGRHVKLVGWVGGNPAERDDDVTPPLFYVIDRYTVATSPA